jgi:hypothetical protein
VGTAVAGFDCIGVIAGNDGALAAIAVRLLVAASASRLNKGSGATVLREVEGFAIVDVLGCLGATTWTSSSELCVRSTKSLTARFMINHQRQRFQTVRNKQVSMDKKNMELERRNQQNIR